MVSIEKKKLDFKECKQSPYKDYNTLVFSNNNKLSLQDLHLSAALAG